MCILYIDFYYDHYFFSIIILTEVSDIDEEYRPNGLVYVIFNKPNLNFTGLAWSSGPWL